MERSTTRRTIAMLCLSAPVLTTAATLAAAPAAKDTALRQRPDRRLLPMHLLGQDQRLAASTKVTIEIPDEAGPRFDIDVPIDGEMRTLQLRKHSVRGGGFRVRIQRDDGSFEEVDPGPVRTYRGSIAGLKDAEIQGTVLATGLEAQVDLGDGREFKIEPDLAGVLAGNLDAYNVFEMQANAPADFACDALAPDETAPETAGILPFGTGCDGNLCTAEIAFDCDSTFYERYGNALLVQEAAEAMLNVANVAFERDLGISHRLTEVIIRPSVTAEPIGYDAATDRGELLSAFRDHWNDTHDDVERDVAHLLTDRFGGGIAWVGVVGHATHGYGVDCVGSYGLGWAAHVLAHELGHNWNADHCTCSAPAYLMNPTFPPAALRFNPDVTVPVIHDYRDTLGFLQPGQPNDNGADAQMFCGGAALGSTAGASADGASTCGASGSSPDVWFTYRPSTSGTLDINTCSILTDYDTVLSLHEGSPQGTQVACNDDHGSCTDYQSRLIAPVSAGITYFVRVSGYYGDSGRFLISVDGPECEAPSNDFMDQALQIGPGDYTGSTHGATPDGSASCDPFNPDRDIWFEYRPAASDMMTVSLDYDLFSPKLSVHDAAGYELACSGALDGTEIQMGVTAGTRYLIRVADADTFRLGLTGPERRNERCRWESVQSIQPGTVFGTLEGVLESWDDGCAGAPGQPDVWFHYRPTCEGTFTLSTCGTNDLGGVDQGLDTVLTVYDLCPHSGGTPIACSDDAWVCAGDTSARRDSFVSIDAEAEQNFWIRVSRYSPYTGQRPFFLHLEHLGCTCPDVDGSGDVGFGDIIEIISSWGPCPGNCPADTDGNGVVDFDDLLLVIISWGPCDS